MWLIRAALRRPITIIVTVIAIALTAAFAVTRMRADIFPDLDLPVIYVAQTYGGMSPAQMEGYLVYYYEYHFLYINIHPGALVGPSSGAGGMPMFRLVEHTRLRLVVPVPEPYTAKVAAGTVVPFSVSAYPNQPFSGKVARVAQAIDVATRTMAVEIDVSNQDGRLSPGTFCQVQWPVTRPGPSLLVPSSSVASTTDRTFVIRVRNGKTEWVDVKTGLNSGPLVEVFGDIRPGDTIANRGTDEVRPGTDVRVREAKSS